MSDTEPPSSDGHPEHLRKACEGSLRRLRLERIDIYQLHAIDPDVSLEEQIGTMRELRDAGKVRHVGLSNVDLDQLKRARAIVEIVSVRACHSRARVCESNDAATSAPPRRSAPFVSRAQPATAATPRANARPGRVAAIGKRRCTTGRRTGSIGLVMIPA